MALTQIQQMTKAEFLDHIQESASQMNRLMGVWEDVAEFNSNVDGAEIERMGFPAATGAGTEKDDLANYRTIINEMVAFYRGTSTSQTMTPADVIDRIRRMR